MIEWWLGRHSSSMRSGLCVELWAGAAEPKSQSVVSVQNACFNVEAVIEIEGFKVGPKRSHVALRNLQIERSKSRSSSSSSSSSEPLLPSDFELALVFDKPGQYTLPITDITRIRCKYLQQGKASIEAKGSLVLLTSVSQGDLERLLLFIRDVKTGKTPVESRSCVVCREKGHKVKHKREELQSSVLDCIFRKRQLLHVNPERGQVLKQLRDLKNRDHVPKSKKVGLSPKGSDDRPYVIDREVFEATSKYEERFQHEMRHYGRENSGACQSPPTFLSRGSEGQNSKSTSPITSRIHVDERSRRVSEDVRRERPGSWSGRGREREGHLAEGEGKENFKGENEVRKIGEETVRRLAEERRRAEEERHRVLEDQRRRVEEEHRRVQEEQRKKHEDERRRREEVRRLEEEERRQVEERERKTQDERRRKEEKERLKEELRKFVDEQERKRKDEKERREREKALEEERRRKEEEERIRQELKRQKQEEERLRKELERRIQEQEQLRKQEEERRRKEEEDQRQREEEERLRREHERRLQEQVFEVRRRQEEEKKKQEALWRQRQEEERQLLEKKKQEELRRHQKLEQQSKRVVEDGRRQKQEAAAGKAQEEVTMRVLAEEERRKQEEIRRRVLDEQREKLEQRRLDEEMRQWQREEDHRRAQEDKWNMSDEERARLDEQRHRVEEVMKMARDLARKKLEENVKEEEKRRQAQEEEQQNEEFYRGVLDDDKRTLDEDIQKFVDKANNIASLEEILIKLKERCSFRNERDTIENEGKGSPTSNHIKGMSHLFTRLEEKKKALKDEQDKVRSDVNRENSSDSQTKAEKPRQEEMKRHDVERKRAEKAANALKKKLLQEQLRASKLEARRLERVRKEAEKRAKAEDRAKQQERAHEQARKQAQEQARQYHYPSSPQRWPSYNRRPLTYQEYEDSWNVMKLQRKGSTLGYADIPWPPAGNPLFIESGDSLDVQRRKLRIALLRWHPDKFMALCGERLGSIDRESIETQAKHLAQQVIQWKSRLEQA